MSSTENFTQHAKHQLFVSVPTAYEKPVFGIPLSVAVERNKCHDGIQLPALFRECVDYIEEHGKNLLFIYVSSYLTKYSKFPKILNTSFHSFSV